MEKPINILFCGLFYPFALLSYVWRALDRRIDVEVKTCGAYTGGSIPWGMTTGEIPRKYIRPVDIPLPPNEFFPKWEVIKPMLNGWKPDLVLTMDAGWHFSTKPDCLSAVIATDSHCMNYTASRLTTDYFFNLHNFYSQGKDIRMAYAFDPTVHYPDDTVSVDTDCCLIGLHYGHRDRLVKTLLANGRSVIYELGYIFDEYRRVNCRAKIGLNWASMQDLNARFFELLGMQRIQIANRVPDMQFIGAIDGVHYLGFDTLEEAVAQVDWALSNEKLAAQIAKNGRDFVYTHHTWDARVDEILKTVGLV
jgi:hypothetical protein